MHNNAIATTPASAVGRRERHITPATTTAEARRRNLRRRRRRRLLCTKPFFIGLGARPSPCTHVIRHRKYLSPTGDNCMGVEWPVRRFLEGLQFQDLYTVEDLAPLCAGVVSNGHGRRLICMPHELCVLPRTTALVAFIPFDHLQSCPTLQGVL